MAGNRDDDAGRIEITPEMIEAGAEELQKFDREYDTLENGAVWIFRAMVSAHQAQ